MSNRKQRSPLARRSILQVGLVKSYNSYGYGSKLNHQESDRRFCSIFPLTRVPFWVHIFDPPCWEA